MNTTSSPDAVSNTSNSSNSPDTSHEISTSEWTHSLYLIIILLLGVVCNPIAFKAMRQKEIRHRPTSIFLTYLALVDSMAVIIGSLLIIVTNLTGYYWENYTVCLMFPFLYLLSTSVSFWLIVVTTVDRCIMVSTGNIFCIFLDSTPSSFCEW